jgi:O-antigen/teichoic acid export membrane protein
VTRTDRGKPETSDAVGAADDLDAGPLSEGEVRRRAIAGAAVDVLRGMGVRVVGLVGTLVLARLLTPHDFGILAFGATLVTFANFLADGGIGAGLVRRVASPERRDLQALLGFQLLLSSLLTVLIGAALLPFGESGEVIAVMTLALPLTAVRAPAVIQLERDLNYRPLAAVELIETVVFYAWAVGFALAGFGVWGFATGSVIRPLVGGLTLIVTFPPARLTPTLSWARVRTMLGFGFQFQAVGVVNLLRDQATNAAVALFAGVTALGVWSVAYRILQIPLLFLGSLWRVSFPGMSRLVAAGGDAGKTIERVIGVVAVASGLILAPLVAATPAWVPAFLGEKWDGVVAVIPPASLHLMLIGPLSVALLGYLWAMGEASAVLRATLAGLPLMAAVMLPLLIVIGAPAVGFGWLASAAGEATVLIRSARKHCDFRITPGLAPPTACATAGAVLGWIVAERGGATAGAGLLAGLLAVGVYVLLLAAFRRRQLLDTASLVARGLHGAAKGPAASKA